MKGLSRTIAFGFAVLAFVLLIVDGTTSIAGNSLAVTRVGDIVARLGDAQTLNRLQAAISGRTHPAVWSFVNIVILPMPALALSLIAMALFSFLGRRGEPDFDMRSRS